MPDPLMVPGAPGVPGAEPEGTFCDCCEEPLPVGTAAKMDRESGVIICDECFDALSKAGL